MVCRIDHRIGVIIGNHLGSILTTRKLRLIGAPAMAGQEKEEWRADGQPASGFT